jgi:hypothetical protein
VLYTGETPLDVASNAGETDIKTWLLGLGAKSSTDLDAGS